MTPIEFVSLSEKELKTLLKNTSQKLGTTDINEIIESVVPVVEISGSGFDFGVVFKKKLRIQNFGPALAYCSFLRYRVDIGLSATSEFVVERYWVEEKGLLKPIVE